MWLIELLWGVLLLEMAESLFKAERGKGEEKRALLKKNNNSMQSGHYTWPQDVSLLQIRLVQAILHES